MANVSRRPQVEADLDEIWQFIATDNLNAADHLVDRLTDAFGLLGRNPYSGRARPELGVDMRSFPVGRYVIFYTISAGRVEIRRVLHGARDILTENFE